MTLACGSSPPTLTTNVCSSSQAQVHQHANLAFGLLLKCPIPPFMNSSSTSVCICSPTSVNNVAICTLNIVFPKVLDIGCFSHTLDHVGEHMQTPVLEEFMKGWIRFFSRSPKARLAWNSLAGVPVPDYSKHTLVVKVGGDEPHAKLVIRCFFLS